MKIILTIILTSLFSTTTLIAQVKKNSFLHKEVTIDYLFEKAKIESKIGSDFINLSDYLPENYVIDGSKDYTKIIQGVLDKHQKVRFPNFPLLINETGLTINDNSTLYFEEKSLLIMKPNALVKYEMLRIHNVKNVVLFNPKLLGDKDKHLINDGEWGMGIAIRGNTSNIKIYNPEISKCWGDGIYIGHLRNIAPKNVEIFNAVLDDHYRNGISITTGENIKIQNTVISNINFNGIKIEPSNPNAIFKNIILNNINTFNNYDAGISIGGLSKLIGKLKEPIEISILNHKDYGSNYGVFLGRMLSKQQLTGPSLKGYIKIVNPQWIKNRSSGFTKRKLYERGPQIQLTDLKPSLKKIMLRSFKNDKDVVFK